jgi:hypothetical protein
MGDVEGCFGQGHKLIFSNLPPVLHDCVLGVGNRTGKDWAQHVKATLLDIVVGLSAYRDFISFVGYRDGRAAVFVDSLEVAATIQNKLHHTLVRGYLLRIRHEDRDEESYGSDVDPESGDATAFPHYASLQSGDRVWIHGLVSDEGLALNEHAGKVMGFLVETGRWCVKVGEKTFKLKPDNLTVLERCGPV